MLRISDAVREIVDHDPLIRAGLPQRLLNLSEVARRLHPAVEARTQKPVKLPAIAMALSRLQDELGDPEPAPPLRLSDRITVQRGLAILTVPNTTRSRAGISRLLHEIEAGERHLTVTEGIREVTLIADARLLDRVRAGVGERPTREASRIASLSVALTREHLRIPGVLHRLLAPLSLQGINLAEVASTTREFHLYLAEDDVMLAMDALYRSFPG